MQQASVSHGADSRPEHSHALHSVTRRDYLVQIHIENGPFQYHNKPVRSFLLCKCPGSGCDLADFHPYFPMSRRAGLTPVCSQASTQQPGPALLSSFCLQSPDGDASPGWAPARSMFPAPVVGIDLVMLSQAQASPATSRQPEIEIILCCDHT